MADWKRYLPKGQPVPSTVLDLLKLGRETLAEEGRWVKSVAYTLPHPEDDPGNPFCDSWAVCSIGALQVILFGAIPSGNKFMTTVPDYTQGAARFGASEFERLRQLYLKTTGRLDQAAREWQKTNGLKPDNYYESIVSFNDYVGTSHEDVLAVWDIAIELEKQALWKP